MVSSQAAVVGYGDQNESLLVEGESLGLCFRRLWDEIVIDNFAKLCSDANATYVVPFATLNPLTAEVSMSKLVVRYEPSPAMLERSRCLYSRHFARPKATASPYA
nr:hypothetical protein CFP56_16754 [Quercus suber]